MPRSPENIHERLRVHLDTIIAATLRADAGAVDAITANARLGADRYSVDFVRRSRQLLLAVSVALSAAVDAHRRIPRAARVRYLRKLRHH